MTPTTRRCKADILSAPERPPTLPVNADGIPAELRERPHWICWKWERRNGKWTKVPINPKSGRNASATDPSTWATFAEAMAYYRSGRADGVGFVFAASDPYCGVDLDDCRDLDSGELDAWAAWDVALLDSYTEISPTSTGVKIIVKGKVPGDRYRTGQVEIYDRARFFALTGHSMAEEGR
jgi:putative DNA primase/helicase